MAESTDSPSLDRPADAASATPAKSGHTPMMHRCYSIV